MPSLDDFFEMRKSKIEFETKMSIHRNGQSQTLPNGDRFVHDLGRGYVVDGVTGEVKEWRVRDHNGGWKPAEFRHDGVIGPGGTGYGLYEKYPQAYKSSSG